MVKKFTPPGAAPTGAAPKQTGSIGHKSRALFGSSLSLDDHLENTSAPRGHGKRTFLPDGGLGQIKYR